MPFRPEAELAIQELRREVDRLRGDLVRGRTTPPTPACGAVGQAQRMLWYVATGDWDGDTYTVLANPCLGPDGSGPDEETEETVQLPFFPIPVGCEPNVREGHVLGCIAEADGLLAVVYPVDDAIGTIKIWDLGKAAIPPGWAACDGTGGTMDYAARFLVGVDADGDYPSAEATGGYKLHGPPENGHNDHDAHNHGISSAFGGTAGGDQVAPPQGTEAQTLSAHSATDNRPPYRAVLLIERVD